MFVSVVTFACLGLAIGSPLLNSETKLNPVEDVEAVEKLGLLREKRTPGQRWLQLLTTYDSDDDDQDDRKTRRKSVNVGNVPFKIPFQLPSGSHSNGPQFQLVVVPVSPGGQPQSTQVQNNQRTECDVRQDQNQVNDYEEPTQRPRRPSNRRPTTRPVESDEPKRPSLNTDKVRYPSYVRVEQLDETATHPTVSKATNSKDLLAKFQAQSPEAPYLPPVLLSEYDGSERIPHPEAEPDTPESSIRNPFQNDITTSFGTGRTRDPQRPRLNRSLMVRAELTVPRADYTESYTAWYDADSGASRVDFYGGSTTTFRTMMPDGTVQLLEMHVDRSGDGQVRHCGKAVTTQTAQDRVPPALPDLEQFTFAGYEETENGRAERWGRTVSGVAGEGGGAKDEALTHRHDIVLLRARDDTAIPLRYTVKVGSSVLGPDCDGYEHRYLDVHEHKQDAKFFKPNIDDLCDYLQPLNASSAHDMARLEPLREFTMPQRDTRYDESFKQFKIEFNRKYVDHVEEAVRKNLLIQHLRFIVSGNREGATFELATNFLADRLDVELAELRGVEFSQEYSQAEKFPHSRNSLRGEEDSLPDRFDWRPRGGVSPVRYQGSCSSCWAFAVAGAVEGALFVRTKRLVPLSEKCLVDCAHPFGGNGCKGTWPSHAYDYVQNRGLPAVEEYTPYADKVDKCVEETVPAVTRISAHVNVTANDVTALKVAIRKHAPSVVIIDAKAKSFVFYKKGVLYDDRCGKTSKKLNHAVLAVGWGQKKGEPNFILKNSWSEAWGERGYARVQARANTCGVLTKPSYPRLEDDDILRAPGIVRVRPRRTDKLE